MEALGGVMMFGSTRSSPGVAKARAVIADTACARAIAVNVNMFPPRAPGVALYWGRRLDDGIGESLSVIIRE